MVLRPKPRESRSLPVLPRTEDRNPARTLKKSREQQCSRDFCLPNTTRGTWMKKTGETSCSNLQDLRSFPRSKAIARQNGLPMRRTCPNTISQAENSCALNGSRIARPSRGWPTLRPSQNEGSPDFSHPVTESVVRALPLPPAEEVDAQRRERGTTRRISPLRFPGIKSGVSTSPVNGGGKHHGFTGFFLSADENVHRGRPC
jgi:hypothetical protein